ncbi:MAG: hypothetical protein V3U87_17100 [Methylococcaceae bacterium]
MDIEKLSWHDGILNEYNFDPNYGKENKITIHLSLYPEQIHSSESDSLQIVCSNIDWFKVDVNMNDLQENKFAGNINHGEVLGGLLRIELFGGDPLVKASKYTVTKL